MFIHLMLRDYDIMLIPNICHEMQGEYAAGQNVARLGQKS